MLSNLGATMQGVFLVIFLAVFIASIKQVIECRVLWLTVDQHLPWKSNTENICTKNIRNFCS